MAVKRDPFALYCDEATLTQQHFVEECDINTIVSRAAKGADVSHIDVREAKYGDFTNVVNYRESVHLVNRANGMFMSLSSDIRERFGNEPANLLDFLNDPSNYDEAVKLGLVKERVVVPESGDMGLKSKKKALDVEPGTGSEANARGRAS